LFLTSILNSIGFLVTEAKDGSEAVEVANAQQPDLFLMDLVMPKKDGYETITQMRQSPHLRDVPAVAVSANAAKQNRERCQTAGFNGFLAKPLDIHELFDTLAAQLNLTWVQAAETQPVATPPADDRMIVPPHSELQILYEMAMFGSMERIEEKAAQLDAIDSKYIPFTNQLRQYTQKFNDEKIIELIKKAMEQTA
jgi:CheY-like chemotaxis protein